MQRFCAIAPIESEPALWSFCGALPAGTLRKDWPWAFHSGKNHLFETPRGSCVYLLHATHFGHLVVLVTDDRDGIVEGLRAALELADVPELARRVTAAATEEERIAGLCALAGVQTLLSGEAMPELVTALQAALAAPGRTVRLAAVRALATLPAGAAAALLQGREDPDNPGLADWRELFQSSLESES